MPKLVCVQCEVEMRPNLTGVAVMDFTPSGVRVVEFAGFGPYKLWDADEWACPSCGVRVVAGFASNPIEHWEKRFAGTLAKMLGDKGLVRLDFENQHQRDMFRTEAPWRDIPGGEDAHGDSE